MTCPRHVLVCSTSGTGRGRGGSTTRIQANPAVKDGGGVSSRARAGVHKAPSVASRLPSPIVRRVPLGPPLQRRAQRRVLGRALGEKARREDAPLRGQRVVLATPQPSHGEGELGGRLRANRRGAGGGGRARAGSTGGTTAADAEARRGPAGGCACGLVTVEGRSRRGRGEVEERSREGPRGGCWKGPGKVRERSGRVEERVPGGAACRLPIGEAKERLSTHWFS